MPRSSRAQSVELEDAPAPPPKLRNVRRWWSVADIAIPAGILSIILLCLMVPAVLPLPAPIGGSILDANLPLFSTGHLLGTDENGNDVLSRLLQGGRTSLLIAFTVNLVGLFAGGSLGALSAYYGKAIDTLIMRALDVLIAFPSLILVLAVSQALPPSELSTMCALTFFSIPAFARVSRASTLRLREQAFMTAAELSGTRAWRVLAFHIAPNVLPQLAAFGLLAMGITISIEGAVSFLGLGVPLPHPSWGNMIYQGQSALSARPELLLLPSLFLFATVFALNMLCEALRTRRAKR
jgi:peptide/nickel transport system permease protein